MENWPIFLNANKSTYKNSVKKRLQMNESKGRVVHDHID